MASNKTWLGQTWLQAVSSGLGNSFTSPFIVYLFPEVIHSATVYEMNEAVSQALGWGEKEFW